MQHQRNKRTGFTPGIREFIVAWFDEIIDDMVADDLGEVDAGDAFEFSEIVAAVNLARKAAGRELVALPPTVHARVNECAKLGMYKGRRDGKPRNSHVTKLLQEATVAYANERWVYRHTVMGEPTEVAKSKAALEAEKLARDELGVSFISAEPTIKHRMRKNLD